MKAGAAMKSLQGTTKSQEKLLSKIKDPEQRAMQKLQMQEQNKAIVADAISAIIKVQGEVMTKMADRIA